MAGVGALRRTTKVFMGLKWNGLNGRPGALFTTIAIIHKKAYQKC